MRITADSIIPIEPVFGIKFDRACPQVNLIGAYNILSLQVAMEHLMAEVIKVTSHLMSYPLTKRTIYELEEREISKLPPSLSRERGQFSFQM